MTNMEILYQIEKLMEELEENKFDNGFIKTNILSWLRNASIDLNKYVQRYENLKPWSTALEYFKKFNELPFSVMNNETEVFHVYGINKMGGFYVKLADIDHEHDNLSIITADDLFDYFTMNFENDKTTWHYCGILKKEK